MNRNCIIQTLEDVSGKSIDFSNYTWLIENEEKFDIHVCVSDCLADVFQIAEAWKQKGSILVQEGKPIRFKSDFYPSKEALLLEKIDDNDGLAVFLYLPK